MEKSTAITPKFLKEGIGALYDMELNNYMMDRAISLLNYRINSLGRKGNIAIPKKESVSFFRTDFGFGDISLLKFISTGAWSGVIIGALIAVFQNRPSRFWGNIGIGFLLGPIVALLLFLAIKIVQVAVNNKKHNGEMVDFMAKTQLDAQRIERENREKNILMNKKAELEKRRNEAIEKIASFYNAVGIDNSYRNIVPIGYMNEFVRLGIATKLEGADGLYYLIRKELRMDQMQYTMNEISSKLDTLIDKTHELHSDLLNINSKCDRLVNATIRAASYAESAATNSAITAYNSGRIAKEQEYQNMLITYNFFKS